MHMSLTWPPERDGREGLYGFPQPQPQPRFTPYHMNETLGYLFAIASFRDLRSLVVEMVLATDMSCHFEQIKVMKSLLQQPEAWVLQLPADAVPTCTHWNANKISNFLSCLQMIQIAAVCKCSLNMHIHSKVCVAAFYERVPSLEVLDLFNNFRD